MSSRQHKPINIIRLVNKSRLQAFLNTDRVYHAYALADLSDPFFSQCRWLAAEEGDKIVTLVLIYKGLEPPVLLAMGKADYLPQIFQEAELPSTAMFMGREAHIPFLLKEYKAQYLDKMWRMALHADNFKPADFSHATPLDESHLPALTAMYRGSHGNAFAPYQLEQGVFYGFFEDGELVSAAGTHVVAPQYGAAAVGNVYTRPQYRGKGLAQQVTSAVCAHLLAQNLDVVLNVEQSNAAAIHIYKKLGFTAHCPFWEGTGQAVV